MDPDQPADLSVKRDRRGGGDSGGSDRFRQRQQHRSHADPSSSRERGRNRERERDRDRERWHARTPDPNAAVVGALDLASRAPQAAEEVIVLSDEDQPRVNGHVNGFCGGEYDEDDKTSYEGNCGANGNGNGNGNEEMPPLSELKELSADEVKSRERTIRRLQEALRNEEMKLVLLKKLQQSHQMKENVAVSVTPQTPKVPNSSGGGGGGNHAAGARGLAMPSSPSHLARGNYAAKQQQQQSQHQGMMPPMVRSHGMHASQQPHSMSGRSSGSGALPANVMLQQNMNRRTPVTTPPNVVMGYPIQSQAQSGSGSTSSSPSLQQAQAADRGDGQTPAQRQAAAKLALRKQLEKTLLQIPPPKPPPPEMHFIPNPSNGEFIYLVGLETIVNNITEETPRKEEPPKPFECIQCGTDFTPVWKWSNPSKGTVTCEQCVTSNIKKALKAEHTNRLKTAFVKALQQEQEIEQRMSQVSCSPPAPAQLAAASAMPASSSSSSSLSQGQPQQVPCASSAMTGASASGSLPSVSSAMQMPRHSEPPSRHQSHAAVAAAAANLTAAHQHMIRLSQHQPLPAHMLTSLNPFLAQAYQYQLLGKSSVSSAELQRQYLLDMIPSRSMPQGSMNWKT